MVLKGVKVEFEEDTTKFDEIVRELTEGDEAVDVGVMGSAGSFAVMKASVHEYGAEIEHPGGTPYGYKTKAAEERNEVRFLKKGEGYLVLGETRPHTIVIPERSYLRSTIDDNYQEYYDQIEQDTGLLLDGKLTKAQMFDRLGVRAVGDVQVKIIEIKRPPLKRPRKDGSSNPLVDTGAMGRSVTYRKVKGE